MFTSLIRYISPFILFRNLFRILSDLYLRREDGLLREIMIDLCKIFHDETNEMSFPVTSFRYLESKNLTFHWDGKKKEKKKRRRNRMA